ncbi:peptide-methionine (S)-S-oxide reductase MsrA [Acuticoccus yangtzensis]|uniref:peptide-methionine (S)-S-oxide reductase MsrA n=1 Tax=Acuticoccus yangtzensis TaxID=1443441 RepID=UPI000949A267|nr:peptide-methionine (S)-S-oxide reductase MsrA [Acuticoccus yangtzensis]
MTTIARAFITVLALVTGLTIGILTSRDAAAENSGPPVAAPAATATAIFAGGCFWCVEADFDKVDGVLSTVSGYTGGHLANPTYEDVVREDTGHYEAVEVTYDPAKVSYRMLVDHFFRTVDPVDAGGQFCDRGESYRTAIFTHSAEEKAEAEAAKTAAGEALGQPIVTPVLDAAPFYKAETYHQDYYEKNPLKYQYYRWSCGRDARVKELWGAAKSAS